MHTSLVMTAGWMQWSSWKQTELLWPQFGHYGIGKLVPDVGGFYQQFISTANQKIIRVRSGSIPCRCIYFLKIFSVFFCRQQLIFIIVTCLALSNAINNISWSEINSQLNPQETCQGPVQETRKLRHRGEITHPRTGGQLSDSTGT